MIIEFLIQFCAQYGSLKESNTKDEYQHLPKLSHGLLSAKKFYVLRKGDLVNFKMKDVYYYHLISKINPSSMV